MSSARLLTIKQFEYGGWHLFTAVFDLPSVCLWLMAFALLAVLASMHGSSLLDLTALMLDQQLRMKGSHLTLLTALIATSCFGTMFKSNLMSQLTRPSLAQPLDSMTDLDKMGADFRILVQSPSYTEDYIRERYGNLVEKGNFVFTRNFQSREIFEGFLQGKLGFFEDRAAVLEFFINPAFNQDVCRFDHSLLHEGREPVLNNLNGHIARKSYPLKEQMTMELMRMDQFGIHDWKSDKDIVFHMPRTYDIKCQWFSVPRRTAEDKTGMCEDSTKTGIRLSLEHLRPSIFLLTLGLAGSLLVFFGEIIIDRYFIPKQ